MTRRAAEMAMIDGETTGLEATTGGSEETTIAMTGGETIVTTVGETTDTQTGVETTEDAMTVETTAGAMIAILTAEEAATIGGAMTVIATASPASLETRSPPQPPLPRPAKP
jgi:uncharacterized protein YqfA (UPF0365 family)